MIRIVFLHKPHTHGARTDSPVPARMATSGARRCGIPLIPRPEIFKDRTIGRTLFAPLAVRRLVVVRQHDVENVARVDRDMPTVVGIMRRDIWFRASRDQQQTCQGECQLTAHVHHVNSAEHSIVTSPTLCWNGGDRPGLLCHSHARPKFCILVPTSSPVARSGDFAFFVPNVHGALAIDQLLGSGHTACRIPITSLTPSRSLRRHALSVALDRHDLDAGDRGVAFGGQCAPWIGHVAIHRRPGGALVSSLALAARGTRPAG